MPSGKSSGKHSSQLLISVVIAQPKIMATQSVPPCPAPLPADSHSREAMDRILQEIAAVGRRLEAMDAKISDLTMASTSIRGDIAGFRETATDLDRPLMTVEDQVAALLNQETELRSLRAKVTDLEDRSRRDNVCLFGIPEYKEGSDIKTFLTNLLPEVRGLFFSPLLEFQRAHRIGPLHKETPTSLFPSSLVSCFMNKPVRPSRQPRPVYSGGSRD
ncbi:hypothetical protein NDU88_004394 [Pleurodeles waltl]|uniref:Uncharacterized protein n=1 Tax=Pleurodeles waltl TaxID=8319 RepID=A0AAV7PF23_PLEWA|nr:hypothetical protein NDU88_004394 [Pleurodeles waltl]